LLVVGRNRAHNRWKASLAEVADHNGFVAIWLLPCIDKPATGELQPEVDRIAALGSALLATVFLGHDCSPQTD